MAKTNFLEKLAQRLGRIDKQELLHLLKELSQDKAALQSILEASGDGVFLLDGAGGILFENRAGRALLGLPGKFSAGTQAAYAAADPAVAQILREADFKAPQAVHREAQVTSPRSMLLSVQLMPVRGEKAELLGTALLVRDITEKRRLEGRMIQSEKLGALSLLAAGLAHEIGNPLNSLNIHLQLMERELKKTKGVKNIRKINATVREEIQRLDGIVHRFLSAIRPLKPALAMHDINAVIRDVLRLLKHEIAAQRIRCETRLSDAVVPTLLDASQIKQALINVVKNAMQAMPKGGALYIASSMQGSMLRVAIRDEGKGIAPENLSKIFEPYFSTREKGSGLGLMMTQRIIKEHAGEIQVQSELGKGTEFLLLLPVRSNQPRMIEGIAGGRR